MIKILNRISIVLFAISMTNIFFAQTTIDLSKLYNEGGMTVINREATISKEEDDEDILKLNAQPGDGLVKLNDFEFSSGIIEVDIRGKNEPGRSFVGIAFNIAENDTYDAIYFRPFNFMSEDPVRKGHSVQYISHPDYTWYKLREEHPEQYENPVHPIPEPDQFFHAKIIVENSKVSVFVNDETDPSLIVNQLSEKSGGPIGLWVGNNSEGSFKNLKIVKE